MLLCEAAPSTQQAVGPLWLLPDAIQYDPKRIGSVCNFRVVRYVPDRVMEDPRLSLNYDVRGPGPAANRAGAGSGHPACVSQLCDDWRRMYIPTSLVVVAAEATVLMRMSRWAIRRKSKGGKGGDRQF